MPIIPLSSKDIFSECCVELSILQEKNIDEGKKLGFTGNYQFDIENLSENEIENGTFSYIHNNGKHNLYKTKDGTWAVSFLYVND